MRTFVIALLLIVLLCSASIGANILNNPGFEPYPSTGGCLMPGPGSVLYGQNGWDYTFVDNGGFPIADTELGSANYRGQKPTIHGGSDAVRFYNYDWDSPAKVIGSQDVLVVPDAQYTASIWVATVGKFGSAAGGSDSDVAGLSIDFLDNTGAVIESDIAKVTVSDVNPDYRQITVTFAAHSTEYGPISRVRFNFYTQVTADLDPLSIDDGFDAYVVFDDAELDGPAVMTSVNGTVTNAYTGDPISDAIVKCNDETTTTDAAGTYALNVRLGSVIPINVEKVGYCTDSRTVNTSISSNPVDFKLVDTPANNLLANPSFEPYATNGNIQVTVPTAQTKYGWTYDFIKPDGYSGDFWCGVDDETTAGGAGWGGPAVIHSGAQALRMYNISFGGTAWLAHIEGSQFVAASPNTDYKGSAYVYTYGMFGQYDIEKAGIQITEFNGDKQPLTVHECMLSGYVDGIDYFRPVALMFKTGSQTAYIKYALVGWLAQAHTAAHLVFDDAVFDGPSLNGVISGTVNDQDGKPIPGVKVSVGNLSVSTDAAGEYRIGVASGSYKVVFNKDGYYSENRYADVGGLDCTVDVSMFLFPQHNLLVNPSFEPAVPSQITATGDTFDQTYNYWRYRFLGAEANHAVDNESVAANFWSGPAMVHSGSEAVRLFMFPWPSSTGTFDISQDVLATHGKSYKASAWILANGAFGTNGDEKAGVVVDILDTAGNVIYADYASAYITDSANLYRFVKCEFVTPDGTGYIRYRLRSVLNNRYLDARVVFDDAALDGEALVKTVQGHVTDINGNEIAGANVTCGGSSTSTNNNGFYSLQSPAGNQRVIVTKSGFCTEQKDVEIGFDDIGVDFVLSPAPVINCLNNPGFELNATNGQILGSEGWTGSQYGWNYAFNGSNANHGIDNEGIAAGFWGAPAVVHSGNNALRLFCYPWPSDPVVIEASQTVPAVPSLDYAAGVWVNAYGDFGTNPIDYAGFQIDLLDTSGKVINDNYAEKSVTTPTNTGMKHLYQSFKTTPDTSYIKYTLHGVIAERWEVAHITFDDAVLGFDSVQQQAGSVADLKSMADGSLVKLNNAVVSAAFDGFFYAEDANRVSGIRVISPTVVTAGDDVSIVGVMKTVGGERCISAVNVIDIGAGGSIIEPLGIVGRTANDNNLAVGLLIRTWGHVTHVDDTTAYISDGSGSDLRVVLPTSASVNEGAYIIVKGVLGKTSTEVGNVPVVFAIEEYEVK